MEAYLRRTAMWYGGVGLLTAQVARSLALPPKYFRLVVQEIEVMGVRSLGVALTAAIVTGMVFTIQSAVNMARFGAETYVGPVAALAILRELGPVLTAILVGGKVASGITAELGSMKVTEQIDALRTLGVNYVKRLVVPRVLASLVVFPLLTVLTDAVGVLGGMVIMFVERGADMYAYWNTMTYWVVPKDFLTGIGKSVFFGAVVTLVGCLIRPDAGRILLFDRAIEHLSEEEVLPLRRRLGFVFQGAALFDSLSVYENVAFPLREHASLPEPEVRARVVKNLSLVGLSGEVLGLLPAELSGGMKKRVGIARALSVEPEVLLFDEPTGGLDPTNSKLVGELIRELRGGVCDTAIVVTHDLELARTVADRVAVLIDGRFATIGPVGAVLETTDSAVQAFLAGEAR